MIRSVNGQIKPTELTKLKTELQGAKTDTARIKIYNSLANGYRYSDVDSGLYYAEIAFKLSTDINYFRGKITALDAKGFILLEAGNIAQSLNCQLTALNILENNPDRGLMASVLNRIGNIYMELKEYETAINYYRQSQILYENLNNTGMFYNELSNIGNVYELMGVLDSAKFYQQKVYDFSIRNTNRKAITYGEMRARFGNVESRLGNFDAALIHYRNGIRESTLDFDTRNLTLNYIQMAKLFSTINQHDSSLYYCRKTIATGELISFKKAIYEASDLMANTFQLNNQTDSAYKYLKMFVAYKDSLYGAKTFQELQLIILNEQERKQQLRQEKEELQNRYRLIFLLSSLFVFLLIAVILWLNNKKQKRTNLELSLQKKQIEMRTAQLVEEKKKSDELLLNILPAETAEELKQKGFSEARQIDEVTVLFTDFKGFTQLSERLTPKELVAEINECFSAFDHIMGKYGVEKIKTIGDSYMAAGGLPAINTTHAFDVVNAALAIQQFMHALKAQKESEGKLFFEIRIGVHSGPLVAGIVGVKKFAYDIWGDTVNTASRMESSSEIGQVNISESTYKIVKDKFVCTHRGKIQAKGKGELDMYFVEGRK
jgi:class 3 adenylate cyclase